MSPLKNIIINMFMANAICYSISIHNLQILPRLRLSNGISHDYICRLKANALTRMALAIVIFTVIVSL
jgi:hypothetical protein